MEILQFEGGQIVLSQRSQVEVTRNFYWKALSGIMRSDNSRGFMNLGSGCTSDISGYGQLYNVTLVNRGDMIFRPST